MLSNRPPWLLVATGFLSLLVVEGCSVGSSSPRDQNWGSDIGRNDGSPDGGQLDGADEASETLEEAGAIPDSATETMDDGAVNAQDTVDSDAVDGETP